METNTSGEPPFSMSYHFVWHIADGDYISNAGLTKQSELKTQKEAKMKKIKSIFARSTILLIPIHLIGSIVNAINSIDKGYGHSYPVITYVLIVLWLFVVFAANVSILWQKDFAHFKIFEKYWCISSIILALMLVCVNILDTYQFGIFIIIGLLITPYGVLFPLLELVFDGNISASILIHLSFCLFNLAFCMCFRKRASA